MDWCRAPISPTLTRNDIHALSATLIQSTKSDNICVRDDYCFTTSKTPDTEREVKFVTAVVVDKETRLSSDYIRSDDPPLSESFRTERLILGVRAYIDLSARSNLALRWPHHRNYAKRDDCDEYSEYLTATQLSQSRPLNATAATKNIPSLFQKIQKCQFHSSRRCHLYVYLGKWGKVRSSRSWSERVDRGLRETPRNYLAVEHGY